MRVAVLALLVFGSACSHARPVERAAALPPAPPATEVDVRASCMSAARACAKHIADQDGEAIIACMPDDVVRMLGGHDALVDVVRKDNVEFVKAGVAFEDAFFYPPSQFTKQGNRTYAVVPQITVMRVPKGHLHQKGFLLAVSLDDGRTWKFVDGVKLTRELAEKLFPAFPSSITLPPVGEPVLVP